MVNITNKIQKFNKKKVFMIVSDFFTGSLGLGVRAGLIISWFAPIAFVCASSISFLSNISTLITNKYFSKLQRRYINIVIITLLYEQTLKQSLVEKKIN